MSGNLWKRALGVLACLALLGTLVLALPVPQPALAPPVGPRNFTLLHTNDEHSEVIPADVNYDFPDDPTTGGLSRIATLIATIEAEKAAVSEPVLVTGSGDFSQGTLFAWLESAAAAELSLMQGIGYDVVALGNHEFDQGSAYRAKCMGAAQGAGVMLPVLSSNIKFEAGTDAETFLKPFWSDTDQGGAVPSVIQPYTVKDLSNGLRVGFFSLLGVEAEAVAPNAAMTGATFGNVYNPDGSLNMEASFLQRVFKGQNMINTLKGQGCDVVVLLSHMGTDEELMLCDYVTGLDVILGGHSHDLNYPPITRNGIVVVQAGAYTKYLGELELTYDDTTDLVSVRNGQAIKIDETVPTAAPIDAWIANYVAAMGVNFGINPYQVYAETDFYGDGGFNLNDGPAFTETNLADLITDSYVAICNSINPAEPVQLGIEANGVIRSGIVKGAEGIFNFYDLFRALPLGATPDPTQMPPVGIPFGYPLCAFYLYGAELYGVLDAALGMGANDFFIQLSGGRYTWRPGGTDGNRVVSFELQQGTDPYQPILPGELYKIATNYYTASFLAAFGVAPRDKTGAPTTVFASRVMTGPREVKAWEALFNYVANFPDTDGDGIPNVPNPMTMAYVPTQYQFPQQRVSSADWNLAEGATAQGMESFVLVQNPGGADVHVNVKFLTGTGEVSPAGLQGYAVPAGSRVTFNAGDYVDTVDVSTKVEPIDGFVVCERAMYGNGRTWATNSIGATAPSPSAQWFFAEGSTGGDFETFILVENPNSSSVEVEMAFLTDDIAKSAVAEVVVPANSRSTVKVNDYLPDEYDVSTYVEAQNGVVVCERAMYGNGRAWGTDSIGAIAPNATWYLPEGSTEGGMETFVLLQNPGFTDVHANISFQTDGGLVTPPELQGVTIPALSRRTYKVNDYATTYNVSTKVEALDGALVCERAMYGGDRTWAHASIGSPSFGVDWYMAEGCTSNGMETFVLIQNPAGADAVVNLSFQTGTGPVAPAGLQGLVIPANSRYTINVGDYLPDNTNVSTRVVAVGGEVVCERAMYGGGRTWGTDSIAFLR